MTTRTETLIREVGGRTVPAVGQYKLDPGHTQVGFVARHLVMTKVRGQFENWTAELEIADRIEDSTLVVRMEAKSITTGNPDRDEHLRSPDFLDVENHKELVFRSTAVRASADGAWDVEGLLEIMGIAKPVVLKVDFAGEGVDPWGNTKLFATASTEINREDWGLTWNVALEAGGLLVSKKIKIQIEVQALPL